MARKIAVILAAVLLITLSLTLCGCATEKYDNYPVVTATPTATDAVSSNGGLAVAKGDYIYFINGAGLYTSVNSYGEVRDGAIMIISKADFDAAYAKDSQAEISDYLYAKAEVVVPKVISQGSTSDKTVQGFYIFGDRIYFFTPNTAVDKDGLPKNTEMCLKSCTLNGRDFKHHYTFASRTTATLLTQKDNDVMCTFIEDGKAYNMTLKGDKDKANEVIAETGSVVFDQANNVMYYVNADSSLIGRYVPGQDKATELVNGGKDANGDALPVNKRCTYTLIIARDNTCYYKATCTANASLTGIYKLTTESTTPTLVTNHVLESVLISGNYLYTKNTDKEVVVYDLTTSKVAYTAAYTAAPTLIFASNNTLYYTVSSKLYKLTAPETFDDKEIAAVTVCTLSIYADYCTYDFCDDYLFVFSLTQDTANTVYPIYAIHSDDFGKTTVEGYDVSCPTQRYYVIANDEMSYGTLSYKIGTTAATRATAGSIITITVSPTSNYELKADSLIINDGAVEVSVADGVYSFIMPDTHVTVKAEFTRKQYAITLDSAITNGQLIVTDKDGNALTSATSSTLIYVKYVPNDGYRLKSGTLKYNTTTITTVVDATNNIMSFLMPTNAVTLHVTFEEIPAES